MKKLLLPVIFCLPLITQAKEDILSIHAAEFVVGELNTNNSSVNSWIEFREKEKICDVLNAYNNAINERMAKYSKQLVLTKCERVTGHKKRVAVEVEFSGASSDQIQNCQSDFDLVIDLSSVDTYRILFDSYRESEAQAFAYSIYKNLGIRSTTKSGADARYDRNVFTDEVKVASCILTN